jgi:ketosteroid isomerase-like protein
MSRRLLLALTLDATAAHAAAQESPADVVAGHERDWAAAVVSKDLARLDALLHPEFRLVSRYAPELGTVSKPEYLIRQEEAPEWAFDAMTPIAIKVELDGGVAVATVLMQVGWPEGVDMSADFRFTDVWVPEGGGWRCVVRYSDVRKGAADRL